MTGSLRDLLRLPEARRAPSSAQSDEFSRSFRTRTEALNRDLQQAAAAGRGEYQRLSAQRQNLYAAYQKTQSQIDPTDPSKAASAIERVLAASSALSTKVSALAASVQSGRDAWLKREEDFDAAILRIHDLEVSQHPKASTFRKISEAIRARANAGEFSLAGQALDQLQPKLLESTGDAARLDHPAVLKSAHSTVPGSAKPPVGGKDAAAPADAMNDDLPKKAKVTLIKMGQAEYDFGRPITREQAARVIFVDGQVPAEATLDAGPGANAWTLRTSDLAGHQATVRKMRGRSETRIQGKPHPDKSTWNPPEPDVLIVEWSDSPAVPSSGPRREDLNNKFGFKILKHYRLDEGRIPERHVKEAFNTGTGTGYEVAFDQPLAEGQVMEKLFDRKRIGQGTVRLKAVPREPTPLWHIEVIGIEAKEAFKRGVVRAFQDANVYAEESVAPDVPAAVRVYLESKQTPDHAVQHPPDVFVWEQEEYIVRVQTDSKGGYYKFETTKLPDMYRHIGVDDERFRITIRYFMIEEGMPARKAWQEFIKHWDWIHAQLLSGLGAALSSGRMPGRAPKSPASSPPRKTGTRKNPQATGGTGQPPVAANAPKTPAKPTTDIGNAPTQPGPPQRPVHGHPLDSTHPRANQQPTVASSGGSSSGGASGGSSSGGSQGGPPKKYDTMAPRNLPDSQQITIHTSQGPKQMTVGQYRQQVKQAEKWISDQMQKNLNRGIKNHDHQQLTQQAADKFGLNKNWRSINNPYIY